MLLKEVGLAHVIELDEMKVPLVISDVPPSAKRHVYGKDAVGKLNPDNVMVLDG